MIPNNIVLLRKKVVSARGRARDSHCISTMQFTYGKHGANMTAIVYALKRRILSILQPVPREITRARQTGIDDDSKVQCHVAITRSIYIHRSSFVYCYPRRRIHIRTLRNADRLYPVCPPRKFNISREYFAPMFRKKEKISRENRFRSLRKK